MQVASNQLINFVEYKEANFGSNESTSRCKEGMKFLGCSANNVGKILLEKTVFLCSVVATGGGTDSKSGTYPNGSTKISNHALSLRGLIYSRRDHDDNRTTIRWTMSNVQHCNLNCRYNICCDAFLRRRSLSNDIRTSKKER